MVTRRRVLRTGLTTVAAVGGTAAALRPMLTAGDRSDTRTAALTDAKAAAAPLEGPREGAEGSAAPLFDEVYRDRRIQGFPSDAEAGVDLYIDGRPLELMRRYDGSWISVANHFQPYTTPIATARGAVDVIGRAELSMNGMSMDSGHHH
ncbi:tyrosinase cofactor [Streptomyces sp. NBC_01476]|uniref:tyrosinase family oxidase copper chaperone n=1 Tax=Streptomyces sp. NBC_01476 TaxID=2903881 RepID=UPI002E2F5C7C|nr:tyrosinase family oxidase copper chaperone [Streptomyces sp. NBC_01476]